MSAEDFDLPDALEALLLEVCAEQGVPARQHDAIRLLVSIPEASWPVCCRGDCQPCVGDQIAIARAVLARWTASGRAR